MKSVKQFAADFQTWVDDTYSLEPASRRYYGHGIKLLLDSNLAALPLDKISNHVCETVSFPGGAANSNCAFRTLRRMLRKAYELKQIQEVASIKLRKEWPRSLAMSRSDAALIASHMTGDGRDAFQILRATGMRPKECFSLRWEFVNFDQAVYRNPRGKTKSARRTIPLLYDSVPILRTRRLEQGLPAQGWVFPASSASGHITSIQKQFVRARKLAGLPDQLVLYCARHGFGTDVGPIVGLKGIMEIMGHSTAATSLGYQHPSTQELQEKLAATKIIQ